jgi:hypothetical protein
MIAAYDRPNYPPSNYSLPIVFFRCLLLLPKGMGIIATSLPAYNSYAYAHPSSLVSVLRDAIRELTHTGAGEEEQYVFKGDTWFQEALCLSLCVTRLWTPLGLDGKRFTQYKSRCPRHSGPDYHIALSPMPLLRLDIAHVRLAPLRDGTKTEIPATSRTQVSFFDRHSGPRAKHSGKPLNPSRSRADLQTFPDNHCARYSGKPLRTWVSCSPANTSRRSLDPCKASHSVDIQDGCSTESACQNPVGDMHLISAK